MLAAAAAKLFTERRKTFHRALQDVRTLAKNQRHL